MKNLPLICGTVMFISFFLPYISVGAVGISGMDIANRGGLYFGLFSIPIVAVLAMVLLVMGRELARLMSLASGVVPILLFFYALVEGGYSLFSLAGVGLWLTALAAIGCIVSVFKWDLVTSSYVSSNAVTKYFSDVKKEVKKVSWLSKKEIIGSTFIVFVFSIIVGVFLFFVDNGFIRIYDKFLG